MSSDFWDAFEAALVGMGKKSFSKMLAAQSNQITAQIRASAGVEDILQTAAEELGRALGVSRAIALLDVRGTSLNPEAPAGQ